MPSGEASRLEAERTIKWCFHIRQKYILKMRKLLKDCKQKVEVSLTRAAECLEVCNVRLSGDYWYASGSREESGVPSSIG